MQIFNTIMSQLQNPMQVYFVRHGESHGNADGVIQGHEDSPLSVKGCRQAEKAGRWFAASNIQARCVFCSPLQRAAQTAQCIADSAQFSPPEPLECLKELNTGIFSGYTMEAIQQQFPDEYERFTIQSWDAVEGAESASSMIKRAAAMWQILVDNAVHSSMNTCVVVSHSGILQWLFKLSFGLTQNPTWLPVISIKNCAVFCFSARPVRNRTCSSWYFGQWSLVNYTNFDTPCPTN